MQTAPAITMNSEVTVEKTGRLMKKSENKPDAPWSTAMKFHLDRHFGLAHHCSIRTGMPSARFCPPETTTLSPVFSPLSTA